MFTADKRVLARLSPRLERVLIADPHSAAAYLLNDIMKSLGARRCAVAQSERRAMELLVELDPQLAFFDMHGEDFDGANLITKLRRSGLPCRAIPVIVVSGDAREATLRQAQNAGAHEFLAKPFTAAAVYRRVENVLLKRRPWIEVEAYVGPCRRRFNSGAFAGARRRGEEIDGDRPAPAPSKAAVNGRP